jgi:hypothetical protein
MTEQNLKVSSSAVDHTIHQITADIGEKQAADPLPSVVAKLEATTDATETPNDDTVSTLSSKEHHVNFGFLPIPKNCRVSQTKPFKFNLAVNLLFGFASTFTVLPYKIE